MQPVSVKKIISWYRDLLRESRIRLGGAAHRRMKGLIDRKRSK